jgi:hypothetical protein
MPCFFKTTVGFAAFTQTMSNAVMNSAPWEQI